LPFDLEVLDLEVLDEALLESQFSFLEVDSQFFFLGVLDNNS
jgi:hypothetical protein